MVRALILLAMLAGLYLLVWPFIVASRYIDERGITIPGVVYTKRESVSLRYSTWSRVSEVTFEYPIPETGGVTFFTRRMDPEHYDAFHKGQKVSLHYLRKQDIPALPLSRALWEMHALPTVRLADQRAFSDVRLYFSGEALRIAEAVAGIIFLLIVLRISGSRLFGWVLGISIAGALALFEIRDFPKPTPRPAADARQTAGRVQSIRQIRQLLAGSRSRGFETRQPVDVVGVELVPEGRTEPVLVIDLIDSGSVNGLTEGGTVPIDYESRSPRTAYIRGASRNFVSSNLSGIGYQIAIAAAVFLVLGCAWYLLSLGYKRLTRGS